MATFSELLTTYMTRTGIGDADLARRVGVNRLTLVRWKEGVTSRPRYREDVVKCAEVLRLTAEEGDELLLSAGFYPENPLCLRSRWRRLRLKQSCSRRRWMRPMFRS